MITITITKVPGTPREITINDGQNLGVALDTYVAAFDEAVDGYELRCSDATITKAYIPKNGDRVYLIEIIKGNC